MNRILDIDKTLKDILETSIQKYSNNKAFSIINGESLTFQEVGKRIEKFTSLLNSYRIAAGEKIALFGGSMPNWPVAYLGVTSSSRVVLPLLPDFTAYEVANILEHSGTEIMIVSKKLFYKLSEKIKERLKLIIELDSLSVIKEDDPYLSNKDQAPMESPAPKAEDIASIIYTSGTSGTSKGVMLTHSNLTTNIFQCDKVYPIYQSDTFLSLLPLSHAYECTVGMLYPLYGGCHVVYLNGIPSPSVLMPALNSVKPTVILSVPLIVEKIYKGKIRPLFTKRLLMQWIYGIMPVRRILHRIAGKKLLALFGGRLRFFGIGGAKLDGTVEQFLRDAKFPYAIGYGLTECSPLIAGAVGKFHKGTTGPTLVDMEMRIDDPGANGIGEIQVKGPNIMKGYFKDEAKTKASFTPDGWFKTKDLGRMDKKGNLYITGRADNMMLGASGENIYPEEIEAIINDNDYVLESVVTQKNGRLVALIHFNFEQINAIKEVAEIKKSINKTYEKLSKKYPILAEKWQGFKEINFATFDAKLEKVKSDLLAYVNDKVNKASQISEIIIQETPFQKTATQKIKRYLYK